MATAISGCVITEDKGRNIKFQKKCDKCGYVIPGTTSTSISPHAKRTSSFRCPKCKENIKLVIHG